MKANRNAPTSKPRGIPKTRKSQPASIGKRSETLPTENIHDLLLISEFRYRQLLEIISDFSYVVEVLPDGSRQPEWVTPFQSPLIGQTPEAMMRPDIWREITHPEDWPIVQKQIEDLLANRASTVEYRIVTPGGETHWVLDHAQPEWDAKQKRVIRIYGVVQDISLRKKAEITLIESKMRYRQLFEQANDAILVENEMDEIVDVNQRACDMFGYTREELLKMKLTDIQAPEVRGKAGNTLKGEFEMHGETIFESVDMHRNGTRIPVEVSLAKLIDKEHDYYLSIVRDISARKQMENELNQARIFLQNVQDSLSAHVAILDKNGTIIQVNAAWRNYAKQNSLRSPNDGVGTNYLAVCDAAAPTSRVSRDVASAIRGILNGDINEAHIEYPCHTPHKQHWFVAHITPVSSSHHLVAVAHEDVTRLKIAEEKAQLQVTALNAAANAIIISDPEGVIQWVNPAYEKLSGYTSEELIGKNPNIINSGFHNREFFEDMWETIRKGQVWHSEIVNRRKDGTLYTVEETVTPLLDSFGHVEYFIGINQDVTQRKRAEQELTRYAQTASTLYELSQQIRTSLDLDQVFQDFHHAVGKLMTCEVFLIALLDEEQQEIENVYLWDSGQRFPGTRQPADEDLTGWVINSGQPLRVNDWNETDTRRTGSTLFGYVEKDTRSVLAVPLFRSNGQCFGMVSPQSYEPNAYTTEHEQLLSTLASQLSKSIENAQLFNEAQRSNLELSAAYDATIEGWSRAMDLRDRETEGHTQRVTNLTLNLARQMGIPETDIAHIRHGVLLHDIGKLGIPDHILLKPGPLTEEETTIMRRHPIHAYEMLLPINYLKPALDIPYFHHEKWDGSGYPHGLAAEQIPLPARIFAVVDVWDALRSNRPYRKGWSVLQAREYLLDQSGKHFEPRMVEAFLKLLDESPYLQ